MIQGHLFGTGPDFLWRSGLQYGSHLGEEKKKVERFMSIHCQNAKLCV